MSIWKKTMLYLGLGADDEYDETFAPPVANGPGVAAEPMVQQGEVAPAPEPSAVMARPTPEPAEPMPRPAPSGAGRSSVRPLPATTSSKPHTVAPVSFNDGQEVADRFKTNQPVIINLQDADRDLSRRIIDFASGLCYGVGGHMEKVANQVYLLTPIDVEVSDEERRQLRDRGLHDA